VYGISAGFGPLGEDLVFIIDEKNKLLLPRINLPALYEHGLKFNAQTYKPNCHTSEPCYFYLFNLEAVV